ncbi:hypothetical protein KSZ_77090 [Dictyobacter formicarum]|uniref:Uncharacterized protein n=1 Tax=Dictyobacter formicarum TaxID=2778368 RepID=A0ABQ3VWE8_9CHLR|nr:hypothetical protein KSZ_77090 [Dictyobacter formicarum]
MRQLYRLNFAVLETNGVLHLYRSKGYKGIPPLLHIRGNKARFCYFIGHFVGK